MERQGLFQINNSTCIIPNFSIKYNQSNIRRIIKWHIQLMKIV